MYTLWSGSFEHPEHFKANVGYETLIGDRTQLSVDLLFSQSNSLYTVRNLNLREPQFTLTGEADRRIFSPAGEFDPTGGNSSAARRNLEFGNVLVNFNDGRARAWNLTTNTRHQFNDNFQLQGSYTWTRAWDNSAYTCCTSNEGYTGGDIGIFGPNDIGGIGDFDRGWGRSTFSREHTLVFSSFVNLPWGIQASAILRSQSGRPWSPVGDDDLNGDGVRFNDRLFVFSAANLPTDDEGDRDVYRSILEEYSCISDFQGEILERNTCRFPWTHQLDMRLSKGFEFQSSQRLEVQVDLFNVLNGIGQLFCDASADDADFTSGVCGLGRWTGVFGADTDLIVPARFDAAGRRIVYDVNNTFGTEGMLGNNLVLQFQAQIGLRYYF